MINRIQEYGIQSPGTLLPTLILRNSACANFSSRYYLCSLIDLLKR